MLGACLHLGFDLGTFEVIGLASDEFSVDLARKAWAIARRRAERKEPVSAATVASAGIRAQWFTVDEGKELEALADGNTLTRVAALQVASDLRLMVRALMLASSLEAEVRAIRSGQWSPGRTASALESLAHQLQRDTAPDEDASGDVLELADGWEANEKTGKSRLLSTGIAALDAEIGGLPPGLTVIASRSGVGKTAAQDSMMVAQLRADEAMHLGFFGLEDGTAHVTRRHMAAATGMLMREIGWKQRTPEQREASDAASQELFRTLQRLHVYRHDTINAKDLVLRIAAMRHKHGIAAAYVDNLTEVDLSTSSRFDRDKEHQRIAELGRQLRNLGLREQFPIVLISHTVGDIGEGQIPTPEDLAGGQALGRRVRLLLSLWEKGDSLRCTIGKANELAGRGTTIEFARLKTAGLIDPARGEKVNIQAERAADKAAKQREMLVAGERLKAERKRIAEEFKNAKSDAQVEKEAQAALFEVEKQRAVEPPKAFAMSWASKTTTEEQS